VLNIIAGFDESRKTRMTINLTIEVSIDRPIEKVAGFVMDPRNDPVWLSGITSSRALTELPLRVGTKVERKAKFLGRTIEYVTEVVDYDPPRVLAMRTIKSPFPMRVRYEFEDKQGATLVRNMVEGEPAGFYGVGGPLLARSVKRSITKDLNSLKRHLEEEKSSFADSPPMRHEEP
jgi:uncharacterized membrane protein